MFNWIRKFFGAPAAPPYSNLWAGEARARTVDRPHCTCLDPQFEEPPPRWKNLELHTERQDTESRAWQHICELIDRAAATGQRTFTPIHDMDPADYATLVTLPPSIGKLRKVRHLNLYGSSLVRIPPEIGEMANLRQFTPYTSYRLHWFPYEITRCTKLVESTVSTRALYGNIKYRPPFPPLSQHSDVLTPSCCSVCRGPFVDSPMQVWISLRVATDVLPLLVHACSKQCIHRLPTPPERYVSRPHQGGTDLVQPKGLYAYEDDEDDPDG